MSADKIDPPADVVSAPQKVTDFLQDVCNCCQLLDGWHCDVAWSPWDTSVRKRMGELLQLLYELRDGTPSIDSASEIPPLVLAELLDRDTPKGPWCDVLTPDGVDPDDYVYGYGQLRTAPTDEGGGWSLLLECPKHDDQDAVIKFCASARDLMPQLVGIARNLESERNALRDRFNEVVLAAIGMPVTAFDDPIVAGIVKLRQELRDALNARKPSQPPTTPSSAAAEPEHKPCPGCGAETDGEFWRWKCGSQDPGPKLGGFRQSDECRRAAAERWPPKQFDAQAIIPLQTFRIRELEQQLAAATRDLTWHREMRDKAIAELGETIIRTDKERAEAADRLAEVTRERDALTEELKSAKHYGDHQRAARLEAEAELSALKTEIGDPDDVEPDVIE